MQGDSTVGSGLVVLGKFADALYVSVKGRIRDHAHRLLSTRKSQLQLEGIDSAEVFVVPGLPGGPLRLQRSGERKYAWVLVNEVLRLSATARGDLPSLWIEFLSHALYQYDLRELESIVDIVANAFLEGDSEVRVSRYDVAVDFQYREMRVPDYRDVVTRARTFNNHGSMGSGYNSVVFGKEWGSIQAEIYNKTTEIKQRSEKYWMYDAWKERGAYQEGFPVWRAELRFFRQVLREMKDGDHDSGENGIRTIADLRESLGDLMGYAVGGVGWRGSWIRVASPESRERRPDRRPPALWWEAIRPEFLKDELVTGRVRGRSGGEHNSKHTLNMLLAYSGKYAAQEKGERSEVGVSLDECLLSVKEDLMEILNAKGQSWEEHVDNKEFQLRKKAALNAA